MAENRDAVTAPDEPSTEAGRTLLDVLHAVRVSGMSIRQCILAVEREARAASDEPILGCYGGLPHFCRRCGVDIPPRAASASGSTDSQSPGVPPPLDVLRADVAAIMSGYPMQGGKPLGMGGRAFEQCREAVLHLIDRASPGLDVDRLAWAIETEDDCLPFLDPGIDSTATPRAIAERIAAAYAAETPDKSFAHRACSTNGCLCDRRDDHAGDGTEDHAARCCDCFDSALVGRAVTDTCCQTCHHAETPEQGR